MLAARVVQCRASLLYLDCRGRVAYPSCNRREDSLAEVRGALVHIGVHKTATSLLQEELFAAIPEIWSVGIRASLTDPELMRLRSDIFVADRQAFETRLEYWRAYLSSRPGRLVVYSDEKFSTGVLSVFGCRFPTGYAVDRVEAATRIVAVLRNARVLCVLREQKSYLVSMYLQLQKAGLVNVEFEEWLAGEWERRDTASFVRSGDYNDLLRIWEHSVGINNIVVVTYEQLSAEPQRFFEAVASAIGLDASVVERAFASRRVNERVSSVEISLRKLLARFPVHAPVRPLLRSKWGQAALRRVFSRASRQYAEMTPTWAARCNDYFASGNRAVMDRYSLPLGVYGYSV